MVFWYKAEEHPPYKIDAPAFWQYHNQHFANSNSIYDDDEDISEITKNKRRGPLINVKKGF
jgi:fatty acid desaturase